MTRAVPLREAQYFLYFGAYVITARCQPYATHIPACQKEKDKGTAEEGSSQVSQEQLYRVYI